MPKMTKTQVDYAIGRLTDLYHAREEAIRAVHETPEKKLTMAQKWEMVVAGRATPRADTPPASSSYGWMGLFDWSAHECDAVVSDTGRRLLAGLKTEFTRAKDEIMLGDAEEALALLRAFAARVASE